MHSDSIHCNVNIEGCNFNGQILEGYVCNLKFKLVKIEYPENIENVTATINSKKIIIKINSTVTSNNSIISLIVTKNGKKAISTNAQVINYSKLFNEFTIDLISSTDFMCIENLEVVLTKMKIVSIKKLRPLKNNIIPVANIDQLPCNNKDSQGTKVALSYTELLIDKLSGIAVGATILSFNPLGALFLLNCVNELSTFQLLNFNTSYPANINKFFNLTSFFNFNFINNPLSYFLDINKLSDISLLENNIQHHNSFQGASFLYNIFQQYFQIIGLLVIILVPTITLKGGIFLRYIKQNFHINICFYMYFATFYQVVIISIGAAFYDNANNDIFTCFSTLLEYIFITLEFLLLPIFLLIIHFNKSKLESFEFENIFGLLYEGIDFSSCKIGLVSFIFNIKIVFLVAIAFLFQNYHFIQLSLFNLFYLISAILIFCSRMNAEFIDNLQLLIKEILLLIISVTFGLDYIFIRMNHKGEKLLRDIILFEIMSVFCNECIFSIISLIHYLINICKETTIRSFILFRNANKRFSFKLRNEEVRGKHFHSRNFKEKYSFTMIDQRANTVEFQEGDKIIKNELAEIKKRIDSNRNEQKINEFWGIKGKSINN